ncbi:hypothetical protein JK386_16530 [Nocardioides sp. zg-536]|uniref:Uncharacterized protein n=1 Tax=Nocardioides faecalis TaxID=2803858 RepID=A0A938Y982_9ACTN|nr:hypothetical protein [Nocardioides faecalis]MBM9461512.1 hypothetical protein [Nocardioides faecalis]QVI57858.1 hypothetical protein KG111_12435 [Nocardioides faecalis]
MELHDALAELVRDHGREILADDAGFRGVLDDVLAEDQASTGDINLLVDAVRFDVLTPLATMIDGGADPTRAVEEAGLRLARDRGGDQGSCSWAAAVLGYAVGKVPAPVIARYRSQRRTTDLPPPGAPYSSPPAAQWPSPSAPPASAPPTSAPPSSWPPAAPSSSPSSSPSSWPPAAPSSSPSSSPSSGPSSWPPAAPSSSPSSGSSSWPPAAGGGRRRRGPVLWVAAAVAGVVVVVGGVTAAVLAGGGDDPAPGPDPSPERPVDVSAAAIDERYRALATSISTGASDCEAQDPGPGQGEVVQCAVPAGVLRLVTYADEDALSAARSARLDYRAGTMTADNGTTALYEFDPERAGTSDPALVYWDSRPALQSVTITGDATAKIDSVVASYKQTQPRVQSPTSPAHPTLREFINLNMDISECTRQRTFFVDETEESRCKVPGNSLVVNVGRYTSAKGMKGNRRYYRSKHKEAGKNGGKQGGGGTWQLGDGDPEGAYYAYRDADGRTATVYWDWDKADCYCYGVAWSFDGNLAALEKWWPSDE